MADDLSLLFRLRGDAAGIKAATAEARAAVAQLKQSFGPELTQTVTVANRAFSDIADNLNVFVGQRVPLVGGAFVRITENLRSFGQEGAKSEKAVAGVAKSIQSIATESGKSIPQIANFLTKFVQLESQAKRDAAAVEFFGAELGAKLIPQLEQTGTELASVASESTKLATAMRGLATPIGLTILAIIGASTAIGVLSKQIFDATRNTAEFEGKLFDLSQQTGVNVETLSALEVLAKTTGGSIDSLAASLGIFQRKLEEAQDPSTKAAALFRQLKIDSENTETALRQTLLALSAMPQGFTQTATALELFGRSGRQMLAILKETDGDLDRAIERFRELGILIDTETAKAADEFNDQLALLQFQLRDASAEISREAIPVVLEALRELSATLKENRETIKLLSTIVGVLASALNTRLREALGAVNTVLRVMTDNLKPLTVALEAVANLYERIAAASQKIVPFQLPSFSTGGTGLTATQSATSGVGTADQTTKQLKTQLQIQKELLTLQEAALDEEKTIAAERLANAQRAFKSGEISRQQELESVITFNSAIIQAELDKIARQRDLKVTEGALAKDDLQKQNEIAGELAQLDRRSNELQAQLRQQEADKRAEFREAEAKELVAHQERLLEIAARFDAARILSIEASVRAGDKTALEADKEIAAIENTALDREQAFLTRKLAIAGKESEERKKIADQIKLIDAQRTLLAAEQETRRQKITEDGFNRQRELTEAAINTALELEQIRAQRIISSIEALADARVIAEEEAARRILAVQLELIDDEIEATKAKVKAAGSIADVDARTKAQSELNNRIKILAEQRISIQAQGDRDVDAGRKKDLDNERRYADELREIKEQIIDVERDTAREILGLLIIHHSSRRDIIRQRLRIDIADETARHQQALETIAALRQENAESNRTQAEKNRQTEELNKLAEAEAERHRLAMTGIKDQGKRDEEEATPLGRIGLDIESLGEFANVIEDTIVPLGEILTRTFLQVADAIGQTVQNWVLLGQTGPAVMRKILAQALASIAAEAAVNAIKELALGFATLFFNPAESAAHFKAAALWGAVAAVAGGAGRAVAGNLFQPTGGGGAVGGGGNRQELNPLTLQRNAGPGAPPQFAPQIQPQRVEVRVTVNDGRFADAIKTTVIEDINNRGPIGEIIANDGNLNRG